MLRCLSSSQDHTFKESGISTIGVDYRFRTLQIGGKTVKVQVFDTSGQERYRSTTASYYRKTDAIILVYDTTDKESFHNLTDWLQEIYLHAPETICKPSVGNKSDLEADKKVTSEEAKYYARELGLAFAETSAKSSENAEAFFVGMIKELVRQADERGRRNHEQEEEVIRLTTRGASSWFRETCYFC